MNNSIIPATCNEAWGFWGTMNEHAAAAWPLAMTAIADATGLALSPSPPSVMTDMAGALLDVVSADILLTQDETYVAEASFRVHGEDINGVFMVMPTQELFETIVNSTKVA